MPKKSILKSIAHEAEKAAIRTAIAKHGSRKAAADALGITRQTLRVKLATK